ncbi:MAG: hydantoinase/oxoprolinase family protein [bacterium]
MRVATDIGGTFTDIVYCDQKGIHGRKVLSTPRNPDLAVAAAIQSFGRIGSFSHGTTVATNALLQRKGARVAFLVTEGFRDLLHIARQTRPRLYDFNCFRPEPVVDRALCFEVPERLGHDGSVIRPLSLEKAQSLADEVKKSGAEAVAICLLFSYRNQEHELLIERVMKAAGLAVSRSSEIIPEFREYERASTTAINAFVQPVLQGYLERIQDALQAAAGPRAYYVMKSNGGVAASHEILPVEAILSGPAGGVAGAVILGREIRQSSLVTFDMGGTSADFSAIVDYNPLWTDEGEIDGLPIRLPMIDITTVGAGGGSIAWLDRGGALRVGPQSAGADPGPACYNRGGLQPTVTDANFLAGLIHPDSFISTGIHLNQELSREAFRKLAGDARLGFEETVLGVRSIVNATMLRGIRRTTVEKGIDVRTFSLLAFGGAGPLHAADLARDLDLKEIIVPPLAGVFSALGILLSDVRLDFSQSILVPWQGDKTIGQIEHILEGFRIKACRSLANQGITEAQAVFSPLVDMRYRGQSFHLSIPYGSSPCAGDADLEARFGKVFQARYGYLLPAQARTEVVNVRLSVSAKREELSFPRVSIPAIAASESPALSPDPPKPVDKRKILQPTGWMEVPAFQRSGLPAGFAWPGPAIIEDEGATIFAPADFSVLVDESGCLRMRKMYAGKEAGL